MITGFQMVSDKEIQFYPIPVQNKLNIVSLKPFVGALITIYSINGIQLYRSVLNGSTVEIDMSHYPSGIYYAKISNGDGIVLTKKIVKWSFLLLSKNFIIRILRQYSEHPKYKEILLLRERIKCETELLIGSIS